MLFKTACGNGNGFLSVNVAAGNSWLKFVLLYKKMNGHHTTKACFWILLIMDHSNI
jgi:hypothetical protein